MSDDHEHAVVKPSESKSWRPSQWTPETVARFGLHVQKHAMKQVDYVTGAKIKSEMDEIRTIEAFRAAGVKRIGDQ
jgi:hypothetical protein